MKKFAEFSRGFTDEWLNENLAGVAASPLFLVEYFSRENVKSVSILRGNNLLQRT